MSASGLTLGVLHMSVCLVFCSVLSVAQASGGGATSAELEGIYRRGPRRQILTPRGPYSPQYWLTSRRLGQPSRQQLQWTSARFTSSSRDHGVHIQT